MVLETKRRSIQEIYSFKTEPPADCKIYIMGLMSAVQDGKKLQLAYEEAKSDIEASKHRDTTYDETLKTLNNAFEYLQNEGIN